jgi:hypothetical protein
MEIEITIADVQGFLTELGSNRPKFPLGVSVQGGKYFMKETQNFEFDKKAKEHIIKEIQDYDSIISNLENQLKEAKLRREEGIMILHNTHLIYEEGKLKKKIKELGENPQFDISFPSIATVCLKYQKEWDLVKWWKEWEGSEKFMKEKFVNS